MLKVTDEQAVAIAEVERAHGNVRNVHESSLGYEDLMDEHPDGTRLLCCLNCNVMFLVFPDGEGISLTDQRRM